MTTKNLRAFAPGAYASFASFAALACLALACTTAACSNETDVTTTTSPPTTTQYEVAFPSTAVAATTETVQVFVFDATNAAQDGTECLALLAKRGSGGDLPAGAARISVSDVTSPCDLLAGGGKGELAISYGARSFLVVAQRGGADYFVGCTTKTVSSANAPVSIALSPASATVAVPATTCANLSDRCANSCQ